MRTTDGRIDGQTDMVIPVYPPNFVAGGIKIKFYHRFDTTEIDSKPHVKDFQHY